jgi:uncharacterized protein
MLGGAFLCYEGFEKLAHKFLHSKEEDSQHHKAEIEAIANPAVDMVQFEKDKIKGAIRTDFILSAEIIVITLGTVASEPFAKQLAVLTVIALAMLDDVGIALSRRASVVAKTVGRGLLAFAPFLMKTLSVLGTAAMFLVGGSIVLHGIAPLHHFVEGVLKPLATHSAVLSFFASTFIDLLVGVAVGAIVLAGVSGLKRFIKR